MSLKIPAPFPIFPAAAPPAVRPATELRLSRWNNANAQPFIRRRREQQEIEDDIRRHRRYHSAAQIADSHEPTTSPPSSPSFKSRGTPSSPSPPSIPGRVSKYSKPPKPPKPPKQPRLPSHPAFRRSPVHAPPASDADTGISIGDHGVSYRVKDAPFEFQYSYTEAPKVKPLALREPPFMPFGPATMPRPWTGRPPLPTSKKKLPEFDSFKLPPHGKKGVKPVQSPGPFLSGSGPKYAAMSREEILGEPLTDVEVKEMIKGCLKTTRQLNMGRDGLTHNMLENIHSHWKRRRVCKIKCKGVCTVDMDNVRQQLEEKTGGKVIYHCGGVIYLFRGRNYNYRTRPRFPLMLWKPVTPVYPRLVRRDPEGLTREEATEMRKKGHQLLPICKLGKNGLYSFLVKLVREAFEECEMVRINCTGLNKSDCRKIGAKLKDLVPCVLLSFAYEHILIWRGKDWISSLPLEDSPSEARELATVALAITSTDLTGSSLKSPGLVAVNGLNEYNTEVPVENLPPVNDGCLEETNNPSGLETTAVTSLSKDPTNAIFNAADFSNAVCHEFLKTSLHETSLAVKNAEEDLDLGTCQGISIPLNDSLSSKESEDHLDLEVEPLLLPASSVAANEENSGKFLESDGTDNSDGSERLPKNSLDCRISARPSPCLDGVMRLLKQAVENGSAVVLDDESLDANIVYERSVSLAKEAAPGPVFQQRTRKVVVKKNKEKEKAKKYDDVDVEAVTESGKRDNIRNNSRSQRKGDLRILLDEVPRGSLGVDELAKLLA